jgi:putative hydrolase of the HAD superfamily
MATRAVFLDALGTMIELEPPWTPLAAELGIESDDRVVRAVRKEMAYYKEHAHEGTDDAALADLRARCAALLSRELEREVDVETMMAAIRFSAAPDARPALERLRRRGLALLCVSNWDVSLPEVLARCAIDDLLDGVVTSAGTGARKPDPAIFAAALALAGCEPHEALHVGDTREEDVAGAEAGIPALLLDRGATRRLNSGAARLRLARGDIASLAEIEQHLSP